MKYARKIFEIKEDIDNHCEQYYTPNMVNQFTKT